MNRILRACLLMAAIASMIFAVVVMSSSVSYAEDYRASVPEKAELVDKSDGVVDNVLVVIYRFETYEELNEYLSEEFDFEDEVDGLSNCWRSTEKNMAVCDIYMVEIDYVDGNNMLTLGHEVAHGIFGPNYHEGSW